LSTIMNTKVIAVREDMTIDFLIQEYFNIYAKDSFPVIDDSNHLVGMITFKDAWASPEHKRNSVRAADIMIQKPQLIIMRPNRTADDALKHMVRKHVSRIFICDEEGKLIGLVSKTDIINAASERKEYVDGVRRIVDQPT
jgi:predicted transcriptional regulator